MLSNNIKNRNSRLICLKDKRKWLSWIDCINKCNLVVKRMANIRRVPVLTKWIFQISYCLNWETFGVREPFLESGTQHLESKKIKRDWKRFGIFYKILSSMRAREVQFVLIIFLCKNWLNQICIEFLVNIVSVNLWYLGLGESWKSEIPIKCEKRLE